VVVFLIPTDKTRIFQPCQTSLNLLPGFTCENGNAGSIAFKESFAIAIPEEPRVQTKVKEIQGAIQKLFVSL